MKDILEKCIRPSWSWHTRPWCNQPKYIDKEIFDSLTGEVGANPVFERAPKTKHLLQLIALPVLLYLRNSKDPELKRMNPWKQNLTADDRAEIEEFYNLHEGHFNVFHMVDSLVQGLPMASYMAATFAYTSFKCPMIVTMEKVIGEVAGSMLEDTNDLELMKNVGLLIIRDVLGTHRGLAKISGSIRTFIHDRVYKGKTTVFLDTVLPSFSDFLDGDAEPKRSEIYRKFAESDIGAYPSLVGLLTGDECYLNFNIEEPLRGLNESRSKFII